MLQLKTIFLFDIDGTIAVDTTLYKGAKEFIDYIEMTGGQAFYITNNSTKSRKDYVEKFKKWGIHTRVEQFITASYATCLYLKKYYATKKIFVLGTPSFVEELKECGLCVTEEVEESVACVVIGYDATLTYEKVQNACELLFENDIDYIGTNPDYRCPTSFGFVPDCGGICEMLNVTVGRRPYYVGKPNSEIVDLCLQEAHGKKEETLVVGDRLYTDIACGINAGVDTAVVLTGEATRESVEEEQQYVPTYCYENILELYESILTSRAEEVDTGK